MRVEIVYLENKRVKQDTIKNVSDYTITRDYLTVEVDQDKQEFLYNKDTVCRIIIQK